MFVIEAYRTLRDRGPYAADQVVKDLDSNFAFGSREMRSAAGGCTAFSRSVYQHHIFTKTAVK